MKTTTIEQSKRLLDAGISRETADLFWLKHEDFYEGTRIMLAPISSWQNFTDKKDACSPAWSLSALWNLCKEKGYSLEFNTKEDTPEGMIEHMVNILADPIIKIMDKLANNQI